MPNTLTGTEAAAAIYAQVRARAARLTEPPCLAAVSVGAQPAALLLTRADATVTLCHRKTPDLAARCRAADILLAAAGAPGLITPECVRPGQIVLDAGATALPDGTLRGDVTPAAAAIAACTPVPGGIGSVTTALLLRHTVQAAEKSHHF